jgi:hypothetical protein
VLLTERERMSTGFRKLLHISFTALIFLGAALSATAQSTGTIRGTVTDPSGAAVAGASVTGTETSTSIVREAATNDSGIFVFPDLPIGTYSLKISAAGFTTQQRPELQLLTGQTIDLPISLQVGSQKEEVTVTSETQQIQTSTSTVQQSVSQEQMRDLPLNGRNPLQLTTLTAGAVLTTVGTESGQQDNTGLSVNGLRATQNTYKLDGSIYIDRFFDSVPIMPNPDALQEFTIQSSNYGADHAGAGALIQLSTRSGTSELHGSAWEYLRNTELNARNYFWHQSYEPPFKLNQFGGTVGGPVFKSKRAFFFFSAEDLQQRSSPSPITIELPTAAQLTGDFSALLNLKSASGSPAPVAIYNPVTGCAYGQTGSFSADTCSGPITNIIPNDGLPGDGPFDALSAAVNKQYLAPQEASAEPAPGRNAGLYNVLTTSTNNNIDNTQYLTRLDYAIGAKDHVSGRYFYNQDNFQRPFTAPLGFYAANLFRNQSVTVSEEHIFSDKLTGAFYGSFYRGARTQIPEAPGLKTLKELGQNINYGNPNESLVPFPGVRANLSYIDVFSGGALTQDSTTFDFSGQAVKLEHRHTLTIGGDLERDRIDVDDYSYTPGDNTFTAQRTQSPNGAPAGYASTGNSFASFYVGYESSFFQDNGRKSYLRELRPALYIQDDWRVQPKLTLNLGLRWDPWVPAVDDNGTLVGFNLADPNFQSKVAPNAPKGMWFVGDPGLSNSVFRNNFKDFAPRVGFAYNVFGNGKTVARGAYGIFYGFPEGLLYTRTNAMQPVDLYLNILNPPQWDDIYAGFSGGDPFPRGHVPSSQFKNYTFLLPLSGGVLNPASKVAYTQAYNFTIEQDLGNGFAFNVGYVGNHAVHVMASRQFNPFAFTPPAFEKTRTYPGLGAVDLADAYNYALTNALNVNVTRRARSLTLLANAVWMKTIDNGSSGAEGQTGPPNPFNLQSARGVADFDQALRITGSVNYPLPKFHVNSVAAAFVNGWQANAIVVSQSGLPITITSGVDNSKSGVGNDYAVYNPGVSIKRPAGASKIQEWFNPAAFGVNPLPSAANGYAQSFGNVPRNSLRGPAYQDTDISLFKDILSEHRVHGQFQAEVFNAWNHTNLANPGSTASSSGTFGAITATGSSTGTVNIPSPIGTQRVWQFVGKVIF